MHIHAQPGSDIQRVLCSTLWLPFSAQLKPLIRLLLERMASLVQEPTKETTSRGNSHVLIDMRDEFLTSDKNNPGRDVHFRMVWNALILMYEDPFYCECIDEQARKFIKSNWDFDVPPPVYD